SVRVVLDVGGTVFARSRGRPEGPRDQDDSVSYVARLENHRLSVRRGAQRQAGGGGGRVEGALRRSCEHPVCDQTRGIRNSRNLWRRRSEDSQQGDPGSSPGLQRSAPLRTHRHRQLSSRDGEILCRLRTTDLRCYYWRRPDGAIQLPDDWLYAGSSLSQDPAGSDRAQARAVGANRARNQAQFGRITRADSVQDERARGRGHHAGSLSRLAGGREG